MKFEGAACAGADVRIFYRRGTNTAPMALCAVCPARKECLSHALQYEEFGVWGGTTAKERRQMREEMNIVLKNLAEEAVVVKTHPFCGTEYGYQRIYRRAKKGYEWINCQACKDAHKHREQDMRLRRASA